METGRISLKQSNRKSILEMFRRNGTLSVADVSYQTGISKPTVQKVVNHFIDKGVIVSAGKGDSTDDGGKKPNLYRFDPGCGRILSIHLGPDFLYGAVTDLNADIIHSVVRSVEKSESGKLMELIIGMLEGFMELDEPGVGTPVSVAVALPGIVDSQKGISVFTPHFHNLGDNLPVADIIREKLGLTCPVYIDCTNRFQAFGEMVKGAAVGEKNFIMIDAMPEGVGAGVVVNGRLKHGSQNISGEIGHMILSPGGPECICGGHGCFQAMVSLKHIADRVSELGTDYPDSPMNSADDLLKSFYDGISRGDELAGVIFSEIIRWFALGLNNVLMVNDPALIVLEGIYNEFGDIFLEKLGAELNKVSVTAIKRDVKLQLSNIGQERGVLGAACFAADKYFDDPALY